MLSCSLSPIIFRIYDNMQCTSQLRHLGKNSPSSLSSDLQTSLLEIAGIGFRVRCRVVRREDIGTLLCITARYDTRTDDLLMDDVSGISYTNIMHACLLFIVVNEMWWYLEEAKSLEDTLYMIPLLSHVLSLDMIYDYCNAMTLKRPSSTKLIWTSSIVVSFRPARLLDRSWSQILVLQIHTSKVLTLPVFPSLHTARMILMLSIPTNSPWILPKSNTASSFSEKSSA